MAADGRCKTLDASADGYVRAEACGTILLRVMSSIDRKSLADDNLPHVLVLGAAVNQDGRSSSLTAPNGPSQRELILATLHAAELEREHMAGIAVHGTGTPLGDPIGL